MIALRLDDIVVSPARATDPATSSGGATVARIRAGSQRAVLLAAYADCGDYGMTDEEAATRSGLAGVARSPWKRCGELLAAGLLRDTGTTRTSTAGAQQRVSVITLSGLRALDMMGVNR